MSTRDRGILCGALLLVCVAASLRAADSPVAEAAMRGDAAMVRALVAQNADVDVPQPDGATALHWAVFRGDREMVDLLLRAGANPGAANLTGSTPLWLAAVSGDAAIIAGLLEAGADPNERLPLGRTPLMIASRTGRVAAMQVLLDAGADPNAHETERGTTALMWAADQGHDAAIRLLIEHGADIAARSDPAPRGRGPALGKANDPRRAVAAQVAAVQAREAAAGPGEPQNDGTAARRDGAGAAPAAPAGRGGAAAPAAGRAGGAGRRGGAPPAEADDQDDAAAAAGIGQRLRDAQADGGQLTALIYAARANDRASVEALLEAGADVNQQSGYGWSALLVATQNRYYQLASYLLDRGADPNLPNNGGWTPLYLATDNRNIESGDYPVRKPDMDHLEFITLLLDRGADVNHRVQDSTETRTVFTNQWLDENGATAFLRASQSGDLELMKQLLARGADPHIATELGVTALQVAAGIGWVEGVTYEWSPQATFEAVTLLLELGLDANAQADTGRTALHGAAHKGRPDVIRTLVEHGADLAVRDYGNTDNRGGELAGHTWQAVDYADGLVRVGVQSAIAHPEAGLLLRELMETRGLEAPPMGRTLESICITDACQ